MTSVPRPPALILAMAVTLSCTHQVESIPSALQRECVSWKALDPTSRSSFELQSCTQLDPGSWDSGRVRGQTECTIGDMRLVGKPEPADVLDNFAEIHSLADATRPVVTLRPEPRVSESMYGAGAGPPIACDSELERVYVGSAFLGFIVAYRPDGRELWRVTLPGFQSVIGKPLEDWTPRGMMKLIDSDGSILMSRLAPMGPFLAACYRVKGRFYESVIHRSGVTTASIGPWDGVLVQTSKDGWVFDAGGEAAHGHWKLPTEEVTVRLAASGPELLIDHFLSYNLPVPHDTQWTWRKCDADNRFGRLDLGERFDPKVDELARTIHDALGTAWARKMAEDDAMMAVMFRGDVPFDEWKARIRLALLNAGADVDCVRYARDHGMLSAATH